MRPLHALSAYALEQGADGGAYLVPFARTGVTLRVVASTGGGWDHVSVSLKNRIPNWLEMSHVKKLFFLPTETVIQYHVPEADHINVHPNCLHLWRPQGLELPRPPSWMVG